MGNRESGVLSTSTNTPGYGTIQKINPEPSEEQPTEDLTAKGGNTRDGTPKPPDEKKETCKVIKTHMHGQPAKCVLDIYISTF